MSEKKEYITKDEAISAIHTGFWTDIRIDKNIQAIPAADVEPVVRGEWIEFDEDMNAYSCSVCNEPQMFIDGNPEQNEYSFCPHCGAHMREKPNE